MPKELRLERLNQRELARYGEAAAQGGALYEHTQSFLAWAAAYDSGTQTGRNRIKHEAWIKTLNCPVVRVENIRLTESVDAVLRAMEEP